MSLISIIATGLVFLMWAIAMFSTLFGMRRRAMERTGKGWPGPIDTLKEWGIWLRDPAFRAERNRLLLMTVCVLSLSALTAVSMGR